MNFYEIYLNTKPNPVLSERTFMLCEYPNTAWALENLNPEELKVWADEMSLDYHTLLTFKEEKC